MMKTKQIRKKDIRRILVIKMRYIGDNVLVTPLLKALKNGYPDADIDVLTNKGTHQVFSGNPFVRDILPFDYSVSKEKPWYALRFIARLRHKAYDMAIDLTNNDRTSFFTLMSDARLRIGYETRHFFRNRLSYSIRISSRLGILHMTDRHLEVAEALELPVEDRHPFIHVSPEKIREIEDILSVSDVEKETPFVVMHPGARRWYKSWPSDRFAKLADAIIREYGVTVILSGSAADQPACSAIRENMEEQAVSLAGQIPLSALPALIRKGLCLIGNDSAPIHVASAGSTPAIALFGPTEWEAWAPRREHDKVLAAEFPCRPCGHSRPDCPLGRQDYCMSAITFEQVWAAVKDTLTKAR